MSGNLDDYIVKSQVILVNYQTSENSTWKQKCEASRQQGQSVSKGPMENVPVAALFP